MKKIFVTGGCGFIASNLTDSLLARGDKVLVLDNMLTGRRENLKDNENLKVVEGSIVNKDLVFSLMKDFNPDIVVHAAASYKDPDDWETDIQTNAFGTANVTQAALESKVDRMIYFQTALCYGAKPEIQPIPLDHSICPESSYSISKTSGEQYIELSGIDYISFRLANPIGPRTLTGPPPIFYSRLSEGKPCFITKSRRDYIFVGDLVKLVLMAIDGKGRRGPYHISSGRDYPIKEVWLATLEAMGLPLDTAVDEREVAEDEVESIFLDPSKTYEDFNWKTETPLKDAVKATIDWYKENGVFDTYTHLKISNEDR